MCERILAHHRSGGGPQSGLGGIPQAPRSGLPSQGVVSSSRPAARVSRWTRCATSGNRSSGKQGYALAPSRPRRGADVTLVSANTALPARPGGGRARSRRALDLQEAVIEAADDADVVVMAAAVADFRPARLRSAPRSRSPTTPGDGPTPPRRSSWSRNPDILAGLVGGARRGRRAGHRGFRRRDRRRRGSRARTRPRQARPQGLRPARGQRGRRVQDLRRRTSNTVHILPPGLRARGRRRPGLQGRTSLPRCGTRAGHPQRGLHSPRSLCGPRASAQGPSVSSRCHEGDTGCPHACSRPSPSPRVTPTRSVTRSRTRSSTPCWSRTPAAASPSRPWSRPGSCTSPER